MLLGERLVVAADFDPQKHSGVKGVRAKVLELGMNLRGLGVYIKVNSVLRAVGYTLIDELHQLGLKVFADLKLTDIPNTLAADGLLLAEAKPEIVTVMCSAGVDAMRALKQAVGTSTEVLGVTVLTSFTKEDYGASFGNSIRADVLKFARLAQLAGLPGVVSAPSEIAMLKARAELLLEFTTPGVRLAGAAIKGDDQNLERVMTPGGAIRVGVKRVVVGRPITEAKPNNEGLPQSPREAAERILNEIAQALEEGGVK